MENLKLNGLLNEYLKLTEKEDEIKSRKEELKTQIITEMDGETKYENGYSKAVVSLAEGFKYLDETAMIKILRDKGYGVYVKEKIDTSFNKVLKENTPITESLQGLYKSTFTEKLSVSKVAQ